MGLVEAILIAALSVAIVGALIARVRGRIGASPEALDGARGSAHERIDEIELARVRSMLQRR